ncbi:MAG: hypothetical protein HY698_01100 [Deltaproteobacteria bacterium]|nr:hypothetical protein [Deltaproteobacteria bacterium]
MRIPGPGKWIAARVPWYPRKVRLAGCILLELAAFASLLLGTGVGVYYGGRAAWERGETPAHAAHVVTAAKVPSGSRGSFEELGLLPLERPGRIDEVPAKFPIFKGINVEYLLAPLRASPVRRVKFNRGGSSISLRIDFEGGGRAAFKPDQTNLQTIPRKEIAAYRIDRLLGLGAVAPAIGRKFSREELFAKIDPADRGGVSRFMAEVTTDEQGMVSGELSWWIPEIVNATILGFQVDSVDGMVLWKRYLAAGAPMPAEASVLLPQLSNAVAFDFLINNVDRWSGSNCKASPDMRYLYFMDNALSFALEPQGSLKVQTYLSRVQKFSRSLYLALKTLDQKRVVEAMTSDAAPYDRLLSEREIGAMMARRDRLVAYIDDLVATHGEDLVLVFP